ncbi:SDR family NAD(P)-dependent oxidoreductase [Halioglobus maricola]|nr:SDR family NAD(P)-dependent oxidoreductase [Halioglobus maricola]
MPESKTIALVTGASSGLGLEFCRQLAGRCDVIIAVARRADRLEALAVELDGVAEVHPVVADLATVEGVAHTMEMLRQKGPADILVNNAGYSPYGYFSTSAIDQQRGMLALHCDATITLCRAAIPFMAESGGGTIINVSSLGSFVPGPGLAVYGATKAFLNYFSQSLAAEVATQNIHVQALCPGLVRTEIHDPMADQGFDGSVFPDEMWMQADQVVKASLAALGSGQVLVTPGQGNTDIARMGAQALLDSVGG